MISFRPSRKKIVLFLAAILMVAEVSAAAQTFTLLDSFDVTDGSEANASLVQAIDGNFYGTTIFGGTYNGGTLFKVTPAGTLNTFYNFCAVSGCPDGSQPYSALVLGPDNALYGTTMIGGASNDGTVCRISLNGTLTTLHSFALSDGSSPQGGLVLGSDGNFYGTTRFGGSSSYGVIYNITPGGTFTVLHNFTASSMDGGTPFSAPMQASDGNFYGVTWVGGRGEGIIYRMTLSGTFSVIHRFCQIGRCTDGAYPLGGLTQGTNGNLYGTTTNADGYTEGTIYKITLGGVFTTLYNFCAVSGCADGISPLSRMELGTNGEFYGTTNYGGSSLCSGGCGTLYAFTPAGVLTTIYTFCTVSGCPDGEYPQNQGLIQGTNGTFYGAVPLGGASNVGTVFKVSVGLHSFVSTNPTSGAVGSTVTILGNSLNSASTVTFNGIGATFTAGSNSYLTAIVPAGATSGKVEVVTSGGTLKSNQSFRILP
jgi:uncharacterized repeat protein (TIGR03803 family)